MILLAMVALAGCGSAQGDIEWSVPDKDMGRVTKINDATGFVDPTPSRPRIVVYLFDQRVSSEVKDASSRSIAKQATAQVDLVFPPREDAASGAHPSYVHAQGLADGVRLTDVAKEACKLSDYSYDPQVGRVQFSLQCSREDKLNAAGDMVRKRWNLTVDTDVTELH